MFIEPIHRIEPSLNELSTLLEALVEEDASIGFLAPLSTAQADAYWLSLQADLDACRRIIWIAKRQGEIVGSVQLALVPKANGMHRADVEKLLVHPQARRQGIAQALLATLEKHATQLGRWLLVLDTRKGDVASQLYRKVGYQFAGEIPNYVVCAQGLMHATCYFYKQLNPV